MATQTQSLPQAAGLERANGAQIGTWLAVILLVFNVVYSGIVLAVYTPNPAAAPECQGPALPTKPCYWLSALPMPSSEGETLFLPVDTPEAAAGRTFGLVMLALVLVSVVGQWRSARWRGWALGITIAIGLLGWGRWSTIPVSFAALGQIVSLLFVLSMIALSAASLYGLLSGKSWAHSLPVAAGAYATLIGAIWVVVPVVLFQVMVGTLLILLLLERQGTRAPSFSQQVLSWTVVPVLVGAGLIAVQAGLIAPAEGIAANTLNWRTIFQRTLEHTKVVLVASLIAIATAVPAGILITRSYKISLQVRRVFTAVPQALLIGVGYALPWLVAWWLQDPVAIETPADLLRALSGPIFWALIVGGGIHWLIYSQTRARPEWGTIDSWRALAPFAINVANIGQTVPSLAVLGLSMSFLGIGFVPAIFALWIRALLPILRNTVAGILSVDPDIVESARGMGMTRSQVLLRVELPLAMAIIFAGIRTAVVFNIGVGALAFYIGAGGLGHLIAIGIALSNEEILLAGGILTALMAVGADFVMGHIEERLVPPTV
jgi:ABC-type proline/glycine betaine transport system permease subunit